jgi:DNA primase
VAGRIPQDFIDDLVERADIADVIGSRIQLKKQGREYKAPCPFHSEKTPSFTVSAQKGFYHCFGCGAHGTALGFLMEFDRLEFPDAVEELAQMLGLEVPRSEQTEVRTAITPLYEVLAIAAQLYQQALKTHSSATEYLKSRGLDGSTVRDFGIGYAPPGWDFLLQHFDTKDETRRNLKSAGLIAERDQGGYYDRFRDRIIFPIRDSRGRVIGFGGRIIGDEEPKYLNSPETAVFHKGRELYGLYEARRATRKLERLLVVEGYMDVVSLACHGFQDSVATLGTATTPEHLRRLFRVAQDVTFCFDGDRAGRDAAWRALQTSLPEMREGRQVRFMFLPDGEDPDSVVRAEGGDGLKERLQNTVLLSDYLLRELKAQTDTDSVDGRARLAELARPLLNNIPDGFYKTLLTDQLATEIGMGREKLLALLVGDARSPAAHTGRPSRQRRPAVPTDRRSSLIRQAIQLILNYPSVRAQIAPPDQLSNIRQRGAPLLVEILEITSQRPNINSAGLLERFRDRPEYPHLETLLAEEILVDIEAAGAVLDDNLRRIISEAEQQRFAELVDAANERDLDLNPDEKDELRGLSQIDTDQPG